MATDKEIKTRINKAVTAFAKKQWKAFGYHLDWIVKNLTENPKKQFGPDIINKLDHIDPGEEAGAFFNRGLAKFKLGELSGALADYDRAIELNPNDAEAFNNRGVAKNNLGDHQGAMADCDRAIELNPDDAKAFHNRALTAARMDAEQMAEETKKKIEEKYEERLEKIQRELEEFWIPEKIKERYQGYIAESKKRLRRLRGFNNGIFSLLFFAVLIIWYRLYLSVQGDGCSDPGGCTAYSGFLSLLSISLTTAFLVSPILFFLRRIHHDMRVERAMLEDYRRKWTLLNLHPVVKELREENTRAVMDHFSHHSTPEVLAEAYAGKSSAREQERLFEKITRWLVEWNNPRNQRQTPIDPEKPS